MTVYSWGDSASIQKMQIRPYAKKGQEAVIYAAAGAQKGQLARVPDMLRSFGLTVIPEIENGQHVLRVRGFESEQELTAALEENGFVDAASRQSVPSPKPAATKKNPLKTIREKSLKASGYVYLIGDAALVASGIKRKDVNEFLSGAAFSSSSIVLARYGEKKVDKAFNDIYDKMLLQFSKEGVEIPEARHLKTEDLGKPNGIIARMEEFLYNHPAEVNVAINAFAGLQLFKSGLNLSKTDKSAGLFKSAAGALITTGMLTALLVPEKAKDKKPASLDDVSVALPENAQAADVWQKPKVEEPKGPLATLMAPLKSFADWVQEKPLRVGGYLAIANNVMQASSAVMERKSNRSRISALEQQAQAGGHSPELQAKLADAHRNKNNWMFNMTAASSYMVANGLLSISSKDADASMGNGDDPFAQIYSASAAILANQPQEVQDTMINKMAFYLAEQKEITRPAEEIARLMRDHLSQVRQSPWIDATLEKLEDMAGPAQTGAKPADKPQDVPATTWADRTGKAEAAAWAEKEAAREAAAKENTLTSGATR
jgi:hypothetical protein